MTTPRAEGQPSAAHDRCRFAPSTTGHAHLGTMLAALLCWLDARSRRAHLTLRFEDIDRERCQSEYRQQLERDLLWLGLDFDAIDEQRSHTQNHIDALEKLADLGLIYACECTRADIRARGHKAPDGGVAYPNSCRAHVVSRRDLHRVSYPLRFRLPDTPIELTDESGDDLSQHAAEMMGDPIVRRRDGAISYQLAVVVDDAHSHISRVVRGRDIAPSTATQVALQRALGFSTPTYRHHLLLLEPRGDKLAKLHGSIGLSSLRHTYDAAAIVGVLACAAGLQPSLDPIRPHELLDRFDWQRVHAVDRIVTWDGSDLTIREATAVASRR